MESLLYSLLLIIVKFLFYLILLFIAFVVVLKLWLEPIKGVCKCNSKLHNKVALVTGGNSGIGLETARDLARRGARVIIASRDTKKSEEAISDIIKTTGNSNVEYKHLDLSKFSSIRKFAEDFNNNVDRLDVLVNNAGCAGLKKRLTGDGIDIVMQINYLGQFLLTNLLLEKLTSSKPSRIVIVSSYAHHFAKFDPEDLAGIRSRGEWTIYSNSKLCDVLWAMALAKRLPNGVTVNALHPGLVNTNIFKRMPTITRKIILSVISVAFKSAKEGAQTSIHLSVASGLGNATGGYYSDCKPCRVSKLVYNEELVERVWQESVRLTESVKNK